MITQPTGITTSMPDVTSKFLIDTRNVGPGRFEHNPDYASFVFELLRTHLTMYENDGYITLVGKLSDIPMEEGEDGEPFFPWVSLRFLEDITNVAESDTIAITINVKRVMRWRGDTILANRITIANWADWLVHTCQMPDGRWRKGTYHYAIVK